MNHAPFSVKTAGTPTAKAKSAHKAASNNLRIGRPNDAFEQEADHVADQVMAGALANPGWSLSKMNTDVPLQRKTREIEPGTRNDSAVPAIVHEVLRSSGQPLEKTSRGFMESRLGHDFSRVRIHTDARAAESAHALNAIAYTGNSNIVFGRGHYQPTSTEGGRLLAHELTHVVQQRAGVHLKDGVGEANDLYERQADKVANVVIERRSAAALLNGYRPATAASRATVRVIQRKVGGLGPAEQELATNVQQAADKAAKALTRPRWLKRLLQWSYDHTPAGRKYWRPQKHRAAKALTWPHEAPSRSDKGNNETQRAAGADGQNGPGQAGALSQVAWQLKNWIPGVTFEFLEQFKLQLGILQPTWTLQGTHLWLVPSSSGSVTGPLPPPDTAQLGLTVSPVVLTVGKKITIAPQIGGAVAGAGDLFSTTKGPDKSGTHLQSVGVVNLQVDYKLSKSLSVTGTFGYQKGIDLGPQKPQGIENFTYSLVLTLHIP